MPIKKSKVTEEQISFALPQDETWIWVLICAEEIDALTAIWAGHPAPRQLILDKGKDLNEFYRLK